MDFMSIEIVVILGVIFDITSAYPYGEQKYWGGSERRSNLRGVLLPRLAEFATLDTRRPSLLDDLLPAPENVEWIETRRSRRRKDRHLREDLLAKRLARKPRLRGMYPPRLEQFDRLEESKYPLVLNKEDIPNILKIADYVPRNGDYRRLRRSKRGRARRTRTVQRQSMIGNSDSMDIIDGHLSSHPTSQELSLYERLSIELARLRCQELQRQRDALRVLEMADPSNFQHRSEHRDQPC